MTSRYYYAGTIRKLTRGLPTAQDYDDIIVRLKHKYYHLDIRYHFEIVNKLNGNHNIHIHFMISSTKKIHRAMILSVLPSGYNVWVEHAKSVHAWNAYITKMNQMDVRAQIAYLHEKPDSDDDNGSPPFPEEPSRLPCRIV